ncbi:MAG: hypothetical protein R8K48_05620 [Gallionella sp.]
MKSMEKTFNRKLLSTLIAFAALAIAQQATAADSFTDALTGGKTSVNMRIRYEGVQQGNAALNATAATARLRLGYETAKFNGFSARVEAATVKDMGNQRYNSKANGMTTYSVIADPQATYVNQAYLAYTGITGTTLKWGRQRLILDNARFIGNVGWRQNEQTFNAFTAVNKSLPDTKITLGYITNVHRIFTNKALATAGAAAGNHKMKSPIINVNYKGLPFGELVGYGYFLDYSTPSANFGNSSKTYGLRFKGNTALSGNKFLYTAEYAVQSNYKSNPKTFNTHYALLELGMSNKIGIFKAGYEVLGSNGTQAFSTPLATLHAFNGWADMFLATPATGLKDAYVSAGTTLAGVKLAAIYHDFTADSGSAKYGKELDFLAVKKIDKNYLVGFKYGNFTSRNVAYVNTRKLWLWGQVNF